MSKRALKKHLQDLTKDQLEEQVIDLYDRFKEVKTYFDFAFNPKEEQRIEEAKIKISLEYFPTGRRKKAKCRRSVAQKYIKLYTQLGMDAGHILDLMLFNVEIAQAYSEQKEIKSIAFFTSMLKSFEQAKLWAMNNGLMKDQLKRFETIVDRTYDLDWSNASGFDRVLD